jgi:Domain of unknown function (DUF4129)
MESVSLGSGNGSEVSPGPESLRVASDVSGAVAAPWLFLMTGLLVPVAHLVALKPLVVTAIPVIAGVSGFAAYFSGRRRMREHESGVAARVRAIILLLLASGLAAWAIEAMTLTRSGLPGGIQAAIEQLGFWLIVSISLAQWLLTEMIARAFRNRLLLFSVLSEKPDALLAATYRDFSDEAIDAWADTRKTKNLMRFFAFWSVAILIIFAWAAHRPFTWTVDMLYGCALVFFLARVKSANDAQAELTFFGEGLRVNPAHRRKNGAIALVLGTACVAVSLVLAAFPAALDSRILADLYAWIVRLLTSLHHPVLHAAPAVPSAPAFSPPPDLQNLQPRVDARSFAAVRLILRILAIGIGAAAAGGLVWLVIAPLFRGRPRRASGAARMGLWVAVRRFMQTVGAWARGLVETAAFFGGDALLGARGRRTAAGAESAIRLRAARHDVLRRAGRRRKMIRGFFKVVRWGERHGVVFSPADGPREYAERASIRVAAAGGELREVAELYERELFAPAPLDTDATARYFRLIKTLLQERHATHA